MVSSSPLKKYWKKSRLIMLAFACKLKGWDKISRKQKKKLKLV